MQCLKCGRQIQDEQVFCSGCLEDMQNYPVKPGTAIQLPPPREERKKVKHKALSDAEQTEQLRAALRRRGKLIVLLLLLWVLTAAAAVLWLLYRPAVLPLFW